MLNLEKVVSLFLLPRPSNPMNTRIASRLAALRSVLTGTIVAATLGLLALPISARATSVTSWTMTTGTAGNISGLNTASPVFGTGATNTGNGFQVYAPLTSYTLGSVGDSISFSGSGLFNLNTGASSDQFRFGIFNTNGSSDTTGWLGYFATNSGIGSNPNGRLWERRSGNTTAYFNNSQTPTIAADAVQSFAGTPASSSSVSTFLSGTYNFSITATRTAAGLSVVWSIVGTGTTTYTIGGTYADTTATTYSFDRVGLMTGGNVNADQVSFSNLDVTFTSAIPEPASWAAITACLALGAAVLRRRSRP